MNLDLAAMTGQVDAMGDAALLQVRPAAQAAAQILYDEVLLRVPSSLKGHWFHGSSFKKTGQKYYFDAGSLRAAIYQAFSANNSGADKATYHVSWNAKKAPYGHMVNNGTSRAAANPFLSNAWDARIADATKAAEARFAQGLQESIGAKA
ncbi:HK97-gp10 family putative phage morphogenesis protein [Variovorax sp. GT1P44]|uniref:HK97-gp10 family putative phage morphogenesis protein n=1 Tax=Variovorax sp. GT1P44 TaxID=3443742 RepID=UPI003F479E74